MAVNYSELSLMATMADVTRTDGRGNVLGIFNIPKVGYRKGYQGEEVAWTKNRAELRATLVKDKLFVFVLMDNGEYRTVSETDLQGIKEVYTINDFIEFRDTLNNIKQIVDKLKSIN